MESVSTNMDFAEKAFYQNKLSNYFLLIMTIIIFISMFWIDEKVKNIFKHYIGSEKVLLTNIDL